VLGLIFLKYISDAFQEMHARLVAIERDNSSLKGVLPKNCARPALDKQRLGELIDLIGTIGLGRQREPLQGHPGPRLRPLLRLRRDVRAE
jgi:hypothetical protein